MRRTYLHVVDIIRERRETREKERGRHGKFYAKRVDSSILGNYNSEKR